MTSIMATSVDYSQQEITPEIVERRKNFLAALRGKAYRQGSGALWNAVVELPVTDNRKSGYFCCIGVACNLLGIPTYRLNEESQEDYITFEEQYAVSKKTARWLTTLNDGEKFGKYGDNYGPTYTREVTTRHTNVKRDFRFIARCLEIIWQLTAE